MTALAIAGAITFTSCKKKPEPGFTPSATTAKVGDAISFVDGKTERKNASYMWDFGDGETSIEQNPSHIYWKKGTFKVYQYVMINTNAEKGKGFSGSSTVDITITGPKSAFSFSPTSGVVVGNPVTFTNSSTDASKYMWSIVSSNGSAIGVNNPTSKDVSVMFAEAGTYTVSLWCDVAGGNGTSFDVSSQTVTVGGANLPNNNASMRAMMVKKWTFSLDNLTYSGNGGAGTPPIYTCPGWNTADGTAATYSSMLTSLTFYEDGTCWLVAPFGNQTTGSSGTWTLSPTGKFLTLSGAGMAFLTLPIISPPASSITYEVKTLSSSSLMLEVKENCSTVSSASRMRAISLQ